MSDRAGQQDMTYRETSLRSLQTTRWAPLGAVSHDPYLAQHLLCKTICKTICTQTTTARRSRLTQYDATLLGPRVDLDRETLDREPVWQIKFRLDFHSLVMKPCTEVLPPQQQNLTAFISSTMMTASVPLCMKSNLEFARPLRQN